MGAQLALRLFEEPERPTVWRVPHTPLPHPRPDDRVTFRGQDGAKLAGFVTHCDGAYLRVMVEQVNHRYGFPFPVEFRGDWPADLQVLKGES